MDDKIVDMINAANAGNPNEFMSAVKDELNTRIMNQIETGRQAYIDTMFGDDQVEDEEDYEEEELETDEEEEEDEEL